MQLPPRPDLRHDADSSTSARANVREVLATTVLRAIVIIFLCTLIVPSPPLVSLTAQQHVQTELPHLCVHTRLMEEVDEWKIQRTLELVRELGAPTIVEFFPWAYLQPERDRYDWASADRIVRHAQNQGIRIIARMGLVPQWARPNEETRQTTLNELPRESYDEFADFVARFAERYQGSIDHLVIWNEPNLSFEWGFRPVSAEEYVAMLREVYAAVKAAVPNTMVLGAPLAPTLEPVGSAAGLNDLLYFEDMYEAGLADVSDGIAMHTYGFTSAPEVVPSANRLNYRRAELLRDIMLRYDDPSPVYVTETGWNDSPRWSMAVAPSRRIAYTLAALDYGENQWDWAEVVCIWVMRFPSPTGTYPDHFTLVTPDFVTSPIYHALQAAARGWADEETLWLPPPDSN